MKLYGTHQLLVDPVDVIILGKSVHTVKKYTEAFVVAGWMIGLEVNVDKSMHMVMSQDQNAGRSHSIKIDSSYFELVKQFRYLETTLMNQNYIQEEIKSRSKSGNACYHVVQNILSSSMLSKSMKIEIHRTRILSVVMYGCETWSLTLREES